MDDTFYILLDTKQRFYRWSPDFRTVFLFLNKHSYSFSVDMQNILITYKKTTQNLNARIPGSNMATDVCMLC